MIHLKFSSFVLVTIYECKSTVVVVDECASSLVCVHHVLCFWNHNRVELALWFPCLVCADVPSHAIIGPHQLSGLENLALDAGLQLLTLARAGRALLAPLPAVLTLLRLLAPALPALALTVPAAQLVDVLPEGRDAGLVAGLALAGGVTLHLPLGVALALAAHALPVIGPGTKFPVVTITGEVVAFAVVARDHLIMER